MKHTNKLLLVVSIIVNGIFIIKYAGPFVTQHAAAALSDGDSNAGGSEVTYHDALEFSVIGRMHNEPMYNRLPAKYKNTLIPSVWGLSTNSSGVAIAFKTNSCSISARWTVRNYSAPANMSRLGACGVDLYCFKDGRWQYVGSGIPTGKDSEGPIISGMDSTLKEFMLYLPTYDGTTDVQIGVSKTAQIWPGNALHTDPDQRILFYGTSITQGGAASRPGMNYPSIISRHLNTEVINLGFSGNGRFQSSVGDIVCDTESKLIVLDCTPNSTPDTIRVNVPKLIRQLRACKPNTPILLVESIRREYSHFIVSDSTTFGSAAYIDRQNAALLKAYREAVANGLTNLHYLESGSLIGTDHEGTVDGTHPSDLGLMRIADAVEHKIVTILKTDCVVTP